MKRTIIGITFLISGILTSLAILFVAISYLPHINNWSTSYPSKLMFLIFAGTSQFRGTESGLGLGGFLVAGIVLAVLGTVMLLKEYFSKREA